MDDRDGKEATVGMDIDMEGTQMCVEALGQADRRVEIEQAGIVSDIHCILGIDLERPRKDDSKHSPQRGAPRTAAMAATQWCAGANRIWCKQGAAWRSIWTERGGWQGARSAQLLFPMNLEEAVDNTPVMASWDITRVGLQDDLYAIASPSRLTGMLKDLQLALQAGGCRRRMHKCKVWFPGWDDTLTLSCEARSLCRPSSEQDRLTTHLTKRLATVQELTPRFHGLPLQAGDGKGRHKAWMTLAKVAMHAFDCDAKLIPSPVLEHTARSMDEQLDEATCKIPGCCLDVMQQRLVQQPGCFGGLGARRLTKGTRADAAY